MTDVAVPTDPDMAGDSFQSAGLGGHTLGRLGIAAPERVAFLGDSLAPVSLMTGK